MKFRPLVAIAALVGALAVPNLAAAATAYAVGGTTNLRAAPSASAPIIAKIVGGSLINVRGCIPDRVWCSASVRGISGWVNANRLEFVYGGRRVLVPQYYGYFGVPIIQFNFGGHKAPVYHYTPSRKGGGGGGGGGNKPVQSGGGGGGNKPVQSGGGKKCFGAKCARE